MMDYKQLIEKDCREYWELLRMREEITAEMEALSDKIKAAMGDHETVIAGEYKVSYKPFNRPAWILPPLKLVFPSLCSSL